MKFNENIGKSLKLKINVENCWNRIKKNMYIHDSMSFLPNCIPSELHFSGEGPEGSSDQQWFVQAVRSSRHCRWEVGPQSRLELHVLTAHWGDHNNRPESIPLSSSRLQGAEGCRKAASKCAEDLTCQELANMCGAETSRSHSCTVLDQADRHRAARYASCLHAAYLPSSGRRC